MNGRRRIGEQEWKQRFDEAGLSEHFELIKRDWGTDHGRKSIVKCKSCGKTFETWNLEQIFKGKMKILTCPLCGMRSNGEIMLTKTQLARDVADYYNSGHSSIDAARKYGLQEYQIENIVRSLGKKRKRLPPNPIGLKKAGNTANEKKKELTKERLIKAASDSGFEYISSGQKITEQTTIRCRECGYTIKRTASWVIKGKCKCPECLQKEKEAQARAEALIKIEQRKKREAERRAKNPNGFSAYQLERENKLDEVFICKECGKEYTPRQYMESAGITNYSNCGYCSIKCRKKAARRKQADIKSIRHRVKKYGCEFDSSVTLKKLIKRDGLRCGICGGMCNPNDHSWTEYFGPTSPTIDHIYPLSKGGSHTWDNVQVAHAICNSTKRDNIEEVCVYDAG